MTRAFTAPKTPRAISAHVRQALGAEQLNLVALTLGTRMGQIYTKRYPQRVRSLLLDSVIPNELILGTEHSVNLEDVLKAQLNRCRDDAECGKTFGDPYADLRKLRRNCAPVRAWRPEGIRAAARPRTRR